MEILSEAGIWARADAHVCALLMAPGRTERRLQAAERTIACAHRRAQQLRKQLQLSSAAAFARAARSVAAEFGQVAWGRMLRVRIRPRKPSARAPQAAAPQLARVNRPRRSRRVYKAPLIDARGRTAVYMRIRYVGLKSKKWSPGLAAKHIGYIYREDALESTRIISNMGVSVAEIRDCWRALEQVETAYRANAIVQYRIVLNLPSELNADQRADLVQRFCERAFARNGLPYAAAVHLPDPGGDQRNFHAHLCFSNRPTYRTGLGEWLIESEKVNGLTDPEGLRQLRAEAAAQLNLACRRAGVERRYTHQTYAERGIDAQRQTHVGGAGMAAYDRGETVARIETNAAIAECNELAIEAQQTHGEIALWQRVKVICEKQADLATRLMQVRAAKANLGQIGARLRAVRAARLSSPEIPQPSITVVKQPSEHAKSLAADLHAANLRQSALAAAAAEQRMAWERQQARQLSIERDRAVPVGAATSGANLTADSEEELERRRAEQAKAAEAGAQLTAAAQRQMHVAEACRLLAEMPGRPYRVIGEQIVMDSAQLTPQQREIMERAGEGLSEIAKALAARAIRDRKADEQEQRADMSQVLESALQNAANGTRAPSTDVIRSSGNVQPLESEAPGRSTPLAQSAQQMSSGADSIAVDKFILAARRAKTLIWRHNDKLVLGGGEAARLGVSTEFVLLDPVQAALRPIYEAQARDTVHVLARMADRPGHFRVEKDEVLLQGDAPPTLREAFERLDSPQFRRELAAYARKTPKCASLFKPPVQPFPAGTGGPGHTYKSLIAAAAIRESHMSGWSGNPRPGAAVTTTAAVNQEPVLEPTDARAASIRAAMAGKIGPAI